MLSVVTDANEGKRRLYAISQTESQLVTRGPEQTGGVPFLPKILLQPILMLSDLSQIALKVRDNMLFGVCGENPSSANIVQGEAARSCMYREKQDTMLVIITICFSG